MNALRRRIQRTGRSPTPSPGCTPLQPGAHLHADSRRSRPATCSSPIRSTARTTARSSTARSSMARPRCWFSPKASAARPIRPSPGRAGVERTRRRDRQRLVSAIRATRMFTVGVTGTNGKTSCSQWIAAALRALGTRCAVIGTLGTGLPGQLVHTGYTTPDAVLLQRSSRNCATPARRRWRSKCRRTA